MSFLQSLFGSGSASAQTEPDTDPNVYPVHMQDSSKDWESLVMAWTVRFNDVLDADGLHVALVMLLEKGDWRKLGGRLRRKRNGRLEILVPPAFTAEWPAVTYTHKAFAMGIDEHPLGQALPRASESPCLQPTPGIYRPFAARPDEAETVEKLIKEKLPQMSLHITSFTDATLVGVTWPHSLMDGMGWQALLRAWSLVLAGRIDEVQPVLGSKKDLLHNAASPAGEKLGGFEEPHRHGPKLLQGLGLAEFGVRLLNDIAWGRQDTQTIFLPAWAVAGLYRRARLELAAQHGRDAPFVSKGDVVVAWLTGLRAAVMAKRRPVAICSIVNLRRRLPSVLDPDGVYMQNATALSFTLLGPGEATRSLGSVALAHRRALDEQTTEPQLLGSLRAQRAIFDAGKGTVAVPGEPSQYFAGFTSWIQVDVLDSMDFAPAVIGGSGRGRGSGGHGGHGGRNGVAGRTHGGRGSAAGAGPVGASPPGKPVYYHAQILKEAVMTRSMWILDAGDREGSMRIKAWAPRWAWPKIAEALEGLREYVGEEAV